MNNKNHIDLGLDGVPDNKQPSIFTKNRPANFDVFLDLTLRCHFSHKIEKELNQFLIENDYYRQPLKTRKAFFCIIANLIINKNKNIGVGCLNAWYKKSRYNNISYLRIRHVLEFLEYKNYIEFHIGSRFTNPPETSFIIPTGITKVIESIKNIKFTNSSNEVVFLKDSNKKRIDYTDCAVSNKRRELLKKYNKFLLKHTIHHNGNNLISILYSTFNRSSFKCGGRIFAKQLNGNKSFQTITSDERRHIMINRNKTVELDFSGLHIRMLYAMKSIQYDKDPYTINSKYSHLRNTFKYILLLAINCKRISSAVYENMKTIMELSDGEVHMDNYKNIIKAFKIAHAPITEYLESDIGIYLQNRDSEMMMQILNRLRCENILALPIHDSIIVDEKYKEQAIMVMNEEYSKMTGGFTCPIKQKY